MSRYANRPSTVQVLIEFKAECSSVRLDRLFDDDPEAEIDCYGIFDKMHNDSCVGSYNSNQPSATV